MGRIIPRTKKLDQVQLIPVKDASGDVLINAITPNIPE